jgi:hypothetical protein
MIRFVKIKGTLKDNYINTKGVFLIDHSIFIYTYLLCIAINLAINS